MKTLLRVAALLSLAGLAFADGIQPIVATGQVVYGSAQKNITSNSDVKIDTQTHVLTAGQGLKTSRVTFNDNTFFTSTTTITASAVWGGITGTISNQADLQTLFNNVGTATGTLNTTLAAHTVTLGLLATSTTTLNVSTMNLQNQINGFVASTTSLQNQVNTNTASIATLSASTTSLQAQITGLLPINLATSVTGILAPSHLVSTVAYTTSNQTFSGQNNWTTILPSTFTGIVVMGSATVNDLSASQFVETDASKHLVSLNLFGANNNWTNFNSFTGAGGASVTFGLQAGSLTITGLAPSGVVQTNGSSLLTTANVNLGSQVTGNLPVVNLNSGTSASALTFWRGDGVWATQPFNASSLAVYNGITQVSSPTVSVGADGVSLTAFAIGSSSAGFKANPSSVTLQGNTFNGASQLVQLDASSRLPNSNGILVTSLNGTNITSGQLADGILSPNVPLINAANIFTNQNTFTSVAVSSFTNGIYSNNVLFGDGTTQTTAFVGNNLVFSNGLKMSGLNVTVSSVSLSSQTIGNLSVNSLNSGTSASNTTFWRGDGIWATPAGGGGASTLAVFNGVTLISSPTVSVGADGVSLTAFAIGASSAGFKINPASGTLQGNTFNSGSELLQLAAGLVPNANVDGSSVTKQSNTFNGTLELVKTDASGHLPALSGVNLTALNASNLTSGSIGSAEVVGVYGNITGLGAQAQNLAMGGFRVTGSSTIASDAATTLATKGYVDSATATLSANFINNSAVHQTATLNIDSGTFGTQINLPYISNYQILVSSNGIITGTSNLTFQPSFPGHYGLGINGSPVDALTVYPAGGPSGAGISVIGGSGSDPYINVQNNTGSSGGLEMESANGSTVVNTTTGNVVVINKNAGAQGDIVLSAGNRSVKDLTVSGVDGSVKVASMTATGQQTVGTLQGASLATCGDATHALAWSGGSFSCQNVTGSVGGGIVSPGTFTWVNTNFGISVSTISASTATLTLVTASTITASSCTITSITSTNDHGQSKYASAYFIQDGTNLLTTRGFLESSGGTNIYLGHNNAGAILGFESDNGYIDLIENNMSVKATSSGPTINSCGTGSPSVAGSDTAGTITVGGGVVTSCSINFGQSWGVAPTCVVSDNSTTVSVSISSIATGSVTFATPSTIGGGTIYYICIGRD